MRRHVIERFERMAPVAQEVLEAFLEGVKEVECPSCQVTFEVKLPTGLSLKAALGALDRAGYGPTQKHVHRQETIPESPVEQLEGLIQDLLPLPYQDRLAIAQGLLPEHAPRPRLQAARPSGEAGASQADATD
jgi:hypothetical protein